MDQILTSAKRSQATTHPSSVNPSLHFDDQALAAYRAAVEALPEPPSETFEEFRDRVLTQLAADAQADAAPAGLEPASLPPRNICRERQRDLSFLGSLRPMPAAARAIEAARAFLDAHAPAEEQEPSIWADLYTKAVVASLNATGLWKRASHIERCGCCRKWFTDTRVPSLTRYMRMLCGDRMCLFCQWKRASRWHAHVFKLARESRREGMNLYTLTLTQRASTKEDAKQAHDRFRTYLRKMTQESEFKAHVHGAFVSVETTRTSSGCWHVHAHILFAGRFWLDADIRRLAARLQGDPGAGFCRINLVRGLDAALKEQIKYPLKPQSIANMTPDLLTEYALAVKGRRCYSLLGSWARKWPEKKKMEKPFQQLRTTEEIFESAWNGDRATRECLDSWAARNLPWHLEQEFKAFYHPEMRDFERPPPKPMEQAALFGPAPAWRDKLRGALFGRRPGSGQVDGLQGEDHGF